MMKQKIFFAVALLTAGALLTSCSNDDMTIENPTEQTVNAVMTFTATLAPKDATTRSVGADGVTTWVENEQIAVYYEKTDDSYGTAIANVDAVNGGAATISASLSSAKNGGTVKFVYPATLQDNTNGELDATKLAAQHGTIDDISANFDAATGSGTLVTDGTTCGTSASITMTNQVLIGKFTPQFNSAAIDEITTLTVSDGMNTYTVTPSAGTFGTDGIYVAMLPVDDKEVIITAATASQNYGFGGKKITLAVGKLYNNLAITMLKAHDLATAAFNADEDAFIYQSTPATATSNTITIGAGRKIILSGVNISVTGDYGANAIICSGNANIVLSGTNILLNTSSSGNTNKNATIKAGPAETTLTISGCGALDATHKCPDRKTFGSVIGGDYQSACGNITIKSGTIVATVEEPSNAGGTASAIGGGGCFDSGKSSLCGDITIEGGTVTATASQYGAGIGSGGTYSGSSTCGSITISGGTVTASAQGGAAIGSGECGSSDIVSCGNIHISGGTVTASINNNGLGAAIGASAWGRVGTITIDGTASVEATATTGTYGAGIGGSTGSTWGDITISGTANVTATGGGLAAGIGSGGLYKSTAQGTCGNISISTTGTVNATGGANGAGIGSGYSYACGTISITGGTITATGGTGAAGIGTGINGTCGNITITSGVTAVDATRDTSDANTRDIGRGNVGTVGTFNIDASVQTSGGKHYVAVGTYGYNKEP